MRRINFVSAQADIFSMRNYLEAKRIHKSFVRRVGKGDSWEDIAAWKEKVGYDEADRRIYTALRSAEGAWPCDPLDREAADLLIAAGYPDVDELERKVASAESSARSMERIARFEQR